MSTDNKNWFARHKVLTVILVLVTLGAIGGAAGNDNKSDNSTPIPSNTAASVAKTTPTATASAKPKTTPTATAQAKQPDVPADYKSALNQADSYANTMHMSKQGVYDQLVSQYGGQFSAAAAQYAVDNVQANWNANALAKAKDYQSQQSLSPAAIHDQLTSSAGEKFTQAEADYAIQHL